MNVLVTGATSGLGRNAAEWLLSEGHRVRATGRDPAAGKVLAGLGAEFVALDLALATPEQCAALLDGIDTVWHCAAKSSPWGDYADFYAANVAATEKLASAAGQRGIQRFVHISTPSIYFDFADHFEVAETYRARRFVNHYAATKYEAEQRIAELVRRHPGTCYVILRPRALFGPHDRVILPRLLQQMQRDRGVLRLPGGGRAVLDLTFVLNVVHAMHLASTRELNSGAIYNIGNQEPGRLADILERLFKREMGLAYRLQAVPWPLLHLLAGAMEIAASFTGREPMLTRYSVGAVNFSMTLSNARAIAELGYKPRYSLERGIRRTAAWLKAQERAAHG